MDLRVELVGQRLIPGRRRMALMSLSLQPVSLILQPPPNRLVYRGTKLGLTSMGLLLGSNRIEQVRTRMERVRQSMKPLPLIPCMSS